MLRLQSVGYHPHEKCDYNGLGNTAEQQQMLVNSCTVILMPLFKVKSSRPVAQCAVYWTGPSCHRGTVPKIEMRLSRAPAVSGLCAGVVLLCWQTSRAQLLRASLCFFTHPSFMGRSGPCPIPPIPHLCDSKLGCVDSKQRLLWS